MIYIVCTVRDKEENIISYVGFDTCTDSTMPITTDLLSHIILNTKIDVVNASIRNNNIVIKEWIHELASTQNMFKYSGPKYVVLALEGSLYKVVDYDGYAKHIWDNGLKNMAELGMVANCSFMANGHDGRLTESENSANCEIITTKSGHRLLAYDMYKIHRDEEFKRIIKEKYTIFLAKTSLLDCGKITFKYSIENLEVKLTEYTGSSRNIIIPPFVTHIVAGAFSGTELSSVKLSNGLKTIGQHSFQSNKISQMEIPESVELIGLGAFESNEKLNDSNNNPRKDRFKLWSDATIMLTPSG